jgi:hypothetical protein
MQAVRFAGVGHPAQLAEVVVRIGHAVPAPRRA